MNRSLRPHPQSDRPPNLAVQAQVERPAGSLLSLTFRLQGDLGSIRLPWPAAPERTDELWRTTCLEAFVSDGSGAYAELNVSPSLRWAAYRFDRYRSGMAEAELDPPRTAVQRDDETFELRVTFELGRVLDNESWGVGVSAVIEDAAGAISYWALAHAPGKPDFHHPDSFVLELPVPA